MDLYTSNSIESLRGNNNFLVHSISSFRGHLGGLLTSQKSIESLLSTSRNNTEGVGSTASNSFIDGRDFRTCSLTTQQVSMHTSNPLFESEFLTTQKLISRSFDVGLLSAKEAWDEEQGGLCSCESSSSVGRRHWRALLAFRSQLVLQTRSKADPSEPTLPLGYFSETPSRDDTVHDLYNEGAKYQYSPSNDTCGKDKSTEKTNFITNEATEGNTDPKDARNHRLLFQYCLREVKNEVQSSRLQKDKSRRSESQTRPTYQTEFIHQRRSADFTRLSTTKSYTANDLNEASASSNAEDSVHNNFRRLKRKTNTSLDDQPTIAQLWAQESQNNENFRRYRGILYKAQRERSGSDHESYLHLIGAGSDKRKSVDNLDKVGGFFRFINCGRMRKKAAQEFSEQCSRLFALAAIPFDHSNDRHVSILQEIYQIYTGSQGKKVESIGDHWKELGFRGTDPALELRSGGILTLLFLLYFYKKDPFAAAAILEESRRDGGVYPFASMCVVVTTWVLRMIQKGKLTTIIKDMQIDNKEWIEDKEEGVMIAAKKLFTGLMYKFHWNMARRPGGNIDLLEVSKQVRREMKKDVEIVIRIADLPDILQLGEHFFRRLTPFQQIKQNMKLAFTCFQHKEFVSDEEHS